MKIQMEIKIEKRIEFKMIKTIGIKNLVKAASSLPLVPELQLGTCLVLAFDSSCCHYHQNIMKGKIGIKRVFTSSPPPSLSHPNRLLLNWSSFTR